MTELNILLDGMRHFFIDFLIFLETRHWKVLTFTFYSALGIFNILPDTTPEVVN